MKKITGALAVAAAMALTLVTSSSAFAASGQEEQPRFCSVLVAKAPPGQDSPIIAEACSNDSQAAADAGLRSRSQRSAAVDTPLMVWWQNTSYTGSSTVIYGNAGPCDGGGYRVTPSPFWQVNLSSIQRNNSCDRATLFTRPGDGQGTFTLDTPTIGRFDNNTGRIQVFSSFA